MKLILVSCVGKKLKGIYKAKDLYVSDWFIKAKKYAEKYSDEWAILSAKYGLIYPEDEIMDYELCLPKTTKLYRKEWSKNIADKINCQKYKQIIILAGKPYREFLIPLLISEVVIPMEGLGIGKQLKWLKDRVDNY